MQLFYVLHPAVPLGRQLRTPGGLVHPSGHKLNRLGGLAHLLGHNKIGCPTLRAFRRVGTSDLDSEGYPP